MTSLSAGLLRGCEEAVREKILIEEAVLEKIPIEEAVQEKSPLEEAAQGKSPLEEMEMNAALQKSGHREIKDPPCRGPRTNVQTAP